MPDKLKLYIVSILAISETTDDQGERKPGFRDPWTRSTAIQFYACGATA